MDSLVLFIIFALTIIIIIKSYYDIHKAIKLCNKIETELTGFECANKVLEFNDINNGYIIKTKDVFDDSYNFDRNIVKLNNKIFDSQNLTSCLVATFISSFSSYNSKLFKLYRKLVPTIQFLINAIYIIFVISACIRDIKILKFCILLIFIFTILLFFTKYFYTKLNKIVFNNLRKLKIVNTENKESITKLLDAYTNIEIMLLIKTFINLKNKIKK